MKILDIPLIEGLESLAFAELDTVMEEKAAKACIDTVCWPAEYPYAPITGFRVARSETHLVVLYHVRGLDLRAAAMEDNGSVWEDSCCEFFVSDPADGTYYNFELNCVGTLLAAKRQSRSECSHFPEEVMKTIIRHSSLEKKLIEENGSVHAWSVAMCIPLTLIGLNPDNLPASIRANFYKCADMTAHAHFLSWNRVETETPDFHRPEFFGQLKF